MMRPRSVLPAVALFAVACTAEPMLLAPDHAVVGGVELHMWAGVDRDFQPSSPPDLKPLIAAVLITAADSAAVPSTVMADSLWVVNAHDTWAAHLTEVGRGSGYARFGAWGGPKWAPGTSVDIYATLRDGAHRQLLEAAHQLITSSF